VILLVLIPSLVIFFTV
jgi:peptidoglycan/LPS O-acetylase OafA/YrhL